MTGGLVFSECRGCPDDGARGCDGAHEHCGDLHAPVLSVLLAELRLHVDDVVLLQEETRRLEDVAVADVVEVDPLVAVLLPDDGHPVEPCLVGQVARVGDRLQQGDPAALHGERSVLAHGSPDGVLEVEELHAHYGSLDVVAVDNQILDPVLGLAQGKSFKMDVSKDRKLDVSLGVDLVARLVGRRG